MPRKKKLDIPIVRIRKGATRKEMYAAVHAAFTADDLQKFTEIEQGIPADDVLEEMEAMVKEHENGKKKRK